MSEEDVLHVLIKDLTGSVPYIELYDNEGIIEDGYYNGLPVIHSYDVLFVTSDNPAVVYLYNVATKTSTLLTVSDITTRCNDIAHTSNKLWLSYSSGGTYYVKEWGVTLNPFNAIYNRIISNVENYSGMGAINDTKLLGYHFIDIANSKVYEEDITNLISVNTVKFSALAARVDMGDYILTTTNKFINLEALVLDGSKQHIVQYNYLTGAMEFDIDITSIFTGTTWSFGLFEYDNEIYIAGRAGVTPNYTGVIYKINKTTPYGLTLYDTTPYGINGASQIPEQLTVHFT
jgi:hypothetical protein